MYDKKAIEKVCVAFVNELIRIGVIKPEDIGQVSNKKRNTVRADIQADTAKEAVTNYLNRKQSVSNKALSNWCANRGYRVKIYDTLEYLLRRGKFTYKQRKGQCIYYVKQGDTDTIHQYEVFIDE